MVSGDRSNEDDAVIFGALGIVRCAMGVCEVVVVDDVRGFVLGGRYP